MSITNYRTHDWYVANDDGDSLTARCRHCPCAPLGGGTKLNPITAARTAARPNPKTIAFIVTIPHSRN